MTDEKKPFLDPWPIYETLEEIKGYCVTQPDSITVEMGYPTFRELIKLGKRHFPTGAEPIRVDEGELTIFGTRLAVVRNIPKGEYSIRLKSQLKSKVVPWVIES